MTRWGQPAHRGRRRWPCLNKIFCSEIDNCPELEARIVVEQGRIVEVLDEVDRVLVKYDDEMDEELHLLCERFQWLAPRAQSAGASSQLNVSQQTSLRML